MCFSAQMSFATGTSLSVFGIYLLRSSRAKNKLPFLLIPLLFGIQQLCEGFVWITQTNPELAFYNMLARYSFLFFAFVLWPMWIPFAMLSFERSPVLQNILRILWGAGLVVSTSLAWLSLAAGTTSAIACHHIVYEIGVPDPLLAPIGVWYAIATVIPFFITRSRAMNIFGILLLGSLIVSSYFYMHWFTSVWCFFAAILSFAIYKIKGAA